jgi:DASS family divalent anion:Na+ symporter
MIQVKIVSEKQENRSIKKVIHASIGLLLFLAVKMLPHPEMLTPQAMTYMAIFLCVIFFLVLDTVPDYLVVIFALSAFVIFGIADLKTAFAPFAQSTVWLLVGAFGIGASVTKSGLLSPVVQPLVSNVYLFIPALCVLVYILRFVIISQTAVLAIFYAILVPITTEAGMSPWILSFAVISSSCVWNLSFHNTMFLSALAATKGEMIVHRDVLPMSVAFMVINIIALMASIWPWRMLGLM